jgi:hypothetical protein
MRAYLALSPPEQSNPKGEEAAFPWRQAPQKGEGGGVGLKSILNYIWTFLPRTAVNSVFYNSMAKMYEMSMDDVPELLLLCGRFAFIQAVRAIFEGHAK